MLAYQVAGRYFINQNTATQVSEEDLKELPHRSFGKSPAAKLTRDLDVEFCRHSVNV
jgi:hypothetical protein